MAVTINASTSTGLVQSADTSGVIELQTNGTTVATVNTSNNVQFRSSISVGNATPTTSGAGITFPATQSASTDANTLDDYEEGTYTVTFTPSGSGSITLVSNSRTFAYTKIGRVVTVTGYAEVSSVSSPTGAYLKISLPFTVANTDAAYASGFMAFNVLGSSKAANIGWANIAPNNTEMHIYDGSINSVGAGAFATYMVASTNVRFSVTYFTS